MKINWPAFIAAASLVAYLAPAHASTTYDFTSGGTPYVDSGGGYGNTLDFGGMTATAWATTGIPIGNNSLIDVAQLHQWSTGLGVCNRDEGLVNGGCSTYTEHQVDNVGDDDYVLFVFDTLVNFEEIKIDPYFTSDRDVSFWIGTIATASVMSGMNPADLDPTSLTGLGSGYSGGPSGSTIFTDYNQKNFTSGSGVKTVDLTGAFGGNFGNALLFAARADAGNKYDNDYFKIKELTVTPIPVPAAIWLFASGLLGLVAVARRKQDAV